MKTHKNTIGNINIESYNEGLSWEFAKPITQEEVNNLTWKGEIK